ncbi:Coatomer subunit beta [Paramicrosporidium saccamoebae]|uniref:Coatomer subunit beta' n=1 Tax=Paramicrosporidium saccamoebae TaxID=1246581 RepID=A0A2H9TK88_9FUNG|nr:Coatomer subunit beta [Paramicrosporidium saccamoebae]
MLASLYSGVVTIWNYETQTVVKTIEVSDMPIRTSKFIPRKNWIITGADDLIIRVYNYNTLEKVTQFEGHSDYIRSFAIHPTRPYVLSCSDDMSVKLWDWEKQWNCVTTYEGHVHYVMAVTFNPKDTNTFATASLDRTIKIWNIGSATANYTLEGHDKGVNCIDYYSGGERPYLVSGADDATVRVWDYQTKSCVRVMEGHVQNISAVLFHPDLPLILSGSEDGSVKVWSSNTFRSEAVFNFSLDRVWALAIRKGSTEISVGFDEGSVVFQLGKGEPAASMDSNGKLIWARHNEILTGNIKQTLEECVEMNEPVPDGQRVMLPNKELGHCEVYPQLLQHSPNGRFVVVCGDGEYIIYTALAWRNKTFGKGLELAWALPSGSEYAVRESLSKITVFQNFVESASIKVASSCEKIFGGVLLGAACTGGQLCFFDWNSSQLVRRIDVDAKRVIWSESSQKAAICTEDSLYILQFNNDIVESYIQSNGYLPEDGLEEAFEFVDEVNEKIVSGIWIADCFVYVTSRNRISYVVGGQTYQIAISERPLYLVGFLAKENRLVLVDKDAATFTYTLSMDVIAYESAILKGDMAAAQALVGSIPSDQLNRVAHFLDSRGLKNLALDLATETDFKFELAVQLKMLDLAYELVSHSESLHKWRELGDLALAEWKTALAEKCYLKSGDLESLLLLYSSSGNANGLLTLGSMAVESAQFNIAFTCYFVTGKREECLELLIKTERYPEAALFARTYLPSGVDRAVSLWRQQLAAKKHRAATFIAEPFANPELFPEYTDAIAVEDTSRSARGGYDSAKSRSVSFEAPAPLLEVSSSDLSRSSYAPPPISPYETAFSDHMSMEVNVGNGSIRADDLDDLASISISESREDPNAPPSRGLEGLSIQELEEEHLEEHPEEHFEEHPEEHLEEHPEKHLEDYPSLKFKSVEPVEPAESEEKDEFNNVEPVELGDEGFHTPQDDATPTKKPPVDIIFDDDDGWE